MANLNKTYSRLDRLFILLENGTTEMTRKAAAKQLGGVQKNHPYDLNNLLARLMTYVQHKDWDTRIAAAEAIKSVITEVPQWLPEPEVKKENRSADTTRDSKRLKFSQIDINQIMNGAQLLLSSSGVEFDSSLDEGIDARERVVRARQRLEKKLGLTVGGGANLGVTSADLFQDEDLIGHSEPGNQSSTSQSKPHSKKPKAKQPCIDIVTQLTEGMSNRERNRAKRKAKLLLKQNSRDATQENESQPPSKKKKTESTDSSPEENIFFSRAPKHEPLPELWVEWPFEWICEELLNLLFSPIWEWRHGACLALRDILKVHGSGAGILRGDTESEMTENNSAWLEDAAIRMLCVMVLDRFADFVSDQVVAPVRESCAQALGVLTKSLSTKTINDILNVLFYLTQVPEWEVRHAGFLGIKYILAVRVDLHEVIVDQCIPSLVRGLRDTDGDVKSVSAEALLPITLHLSRKETSSSHLRSLMEVLCGSLRDLDELTASTQSILTLLSKLVATISLQNISLLMNIKGTMSNLWVFLQHSIAAVRHSALLTLDALLNCMNVEGKIPWFESLASDGLLGLFQCCVLEPQPHIQKLAVQVWIRFAEKIPQMVLCNLCQQYFATWLLLAAQPENVPFAPTIFGVAAGQMTPSEDGTEHGGSFKYIAGNPNKRKDGNSETRSESVSRTRHHVSRMLGVLCGHSCLPSEDPFVIQTVHAVGHHLTIAITSRFALHRIVGCLILSSWWKSQTCTPPPHLHTAILHTLTEELYFNEITSLFVQVQSEIKQILLLAAKTLANPLSFALKQVYSLEEALNLVCELQQRLSEFESTELKDAYQRLHHIANEAQNEHQTLQRIVRSYTAHCLVISCCESSSTKSSVSIAQITKMNPIIRPLMEGLKNEENKVIRETISQSLTHLLDLCCDRDPCPNPKLIRNICQSLRGDNSTFPSLLDPALDIPDDILENANITSKENAIHYALLSLVRKNAMAAAQNSEGKRKRTLQELGVSPQRANSVNKNNPNLARGGALSCLDCACVHFDEKIFSALPQLWSIIAEPQRSPAQSNGVCSKKEAVDVELLNDKMISLLVVEAVAKSVNNTVAESKILVLLPDMLQLIWSPYSAVRFVCSRCLASLAIRFSAKFMTLFIEKFLPSIDASDDLYKRMGTVEMVANIIKCLGIDVLPYTVLLIVPLLGRMGDQNVQIRLIATQCFASLIQYLPVESSIPNPPNMPESLVSKKKSERRFLEQLLDSSSLDEYHIPVPINAKLRTYQQDGVKWMAFLNRYKLHGVLCDDMGLGKTLQSICILASDHYYRQEEYAKTKASNSVPLPSLVVCPPTLTGHWIDEIGKFCSSKYLNPLHYAGHPMERAKLQAQLKHHNLVVASYEVVRNDITFFRDVVWNYCILDEGHMIRNGKSKLTICVKTIKSNHRLILTGTPIQNSVLELWSLFDFLIPGFLGSENEFSTRYSKPIIASRDAKSTSKEQEEGVMAMEALHKQVLPFMLRRMKEDVLQDLPPKIIQDYYCNLSPLQVRLYEDFAKTRAKKDVDTSIAQADMDKNQTSRSKHTSHVFQALQYLQKVSNHPALVLTPCHPEYKQVMDHLDKEKTSLHDIQHSSKLVALKQLLLDCGIGAEDNNMDSIVNQHRALIFCQHKSMLDILEDDLLRTHMPTVTYLRLDGSVAANSRHGIVSKFNNDPSIDLLLLTTKVGGLGLNLTGADTVIFIEHDWNPTTDLQAMDRAHRIGQKRVVNVYRLITRGTLEEKILGLQQFKLNIANTVVSTENSSLHSMGTNQLLELFTIDKSSKLQKKMKETSGKGIRTLLEEVGELWDQSQYDTEYNLDNFMESLVI